MGAEGLPGRDGENLLLAEGGPAFAAAVSRLLSSSTLRQELGTSGRLLLEREFTWEKVWGKLDL
jgi:glycosyltransferase involved in cell wall biosynthesis